MRLTQIPHKVNAKHEDEITSLHVATKNLHLEMMELLLSQKKN
ncbi:hypothetical protein PRO82_000536 [Candidatus Protochlamydia amoebophila]|nr:hypothetical protein [Candidatus Protochlamydia amoebophila]